MVEVLRSRLYPNIPKSDSDIYVVTQTGDRLDQLSNQFYGDSSLWWIIGTQIIYMMLGLL